LCPLIAGTMHHLMSLGGFTNLALVQEEKDLIKLRPICKNAKQNH